MCFLPISLYVVTPIKRISVAIIGKFEILKGCSPKDITTILNLCVWVVRGLYHVRCNYDLIRYIMYLQLCMGVIFRHYNQVIVFI